LKSIDILSFPWDNPDKLAKEFDFIKSSSTRKVIKYKFGDRILFIKNYKVKEEGKYIFHRYKASKALTEWNNGNRLLKAGIPTLKPLAVFERWKNNKVYDSFIVTDEIKNVINAKDFLLSEKNNELRKIFLIAIINFMKKMHSVNFYHDDMKFAHILLDKEYSKDFRFTIIDLDNGLFLKGYHLWGMAKNYLQLMKSIPDEAMKSEEKLFFTKEYCDNKSINLFLLKFVIRLILIQKQIKEIKRGFFKIIRNLFKLIIKKM